MYALKFWCKQLLETKERKEAASTKLQLQMKAQDAFQVWKKRKDETDRRKKQIEREEMKQRQLASTEVCVVYPRGCLYTMCVS